MVIKDIPYEEQLNNPELLAWKGDNWGKWERNLQYHGTGTGLTEAGQLLSFCKGMGLLDEGVRASLEQWNKLVINCLV